ILEIEKQAKLANLRAQELANIEKEKLLAGLLSEDLLYGIYGTGVKKFTNK
ncbi:1284_t:CDS:2, partial [Cetraspora pellucida]